MGRLILSPLLQVDADQVQGRLRNSLRRVDALKRLYVGMFEPEKLLAVFPEMQGLIPIALLPLGYPAVGAHPSRLHAQRKELSDLVQTL